MKTLKTLKLLTATAILALSVNTLSANDDPACASWKTRSFTTYWKVQTSMEKKDYSDIAYQFQNAVSDNKNAINVCTNSGTKYPFGYLFRQKESLRRMMKKYLGNMQAQMSDTERQSFAEND